MYICINTIHTYSCLVNYMEIHAGIYVSKNTNFREHKATKS